jgi:hypothetical protein
MVADLTFCLCVSRYASGPETESKSKIGVNVYVFKPESALFSGSFSRSANASLSVSFLEVNPNPKTQQQTSSPTITSPYSHDTTPEALDPHGNASSCGSTLICFSRP